MNRIADFFYRRTNLAYCLGLTGLMVAYASIVLGKQSACFQTQLGEDITVLGLQFGYSHEYALSFFRALDASGLACYVDFILIWDNIFPLIYGLMYIFWLSLLYRKTVFAKPAFKLINLFPLIPMVLDWLENFFELRMAGHYARFNDLEATLSAISAFVSQIKWLGSSMNYVIILIGIGLLIRRRLLDK